MVKRNIFIVLLLVIAATITLRNLGLQYNFIGEDSGAAFEFPKILPSFTYFMWDEFVNLGKPNVTTTFNVIWLTSIMVLNKLGLAVPVIKRFIYFSFFAVAGIGFYQFSQLILRLYTKKNNSIIRYAAFVASLIYILNHFTMGITTYPINPYHISFMIFPWLFYFFIYNVQVKTSLRSVFAFSLVACITAGSNPSNTLSIIFYLALYFLFFLPEIKKNKTKPWLFIICSGVLILLLSSYIVLPMSTVPNPYGDVGTKSALVGSLKVHSTNAALYNVFRLAAPADWSILNYSKIYDSSPIFLSLGYILPLLALGGLFTKFSSRLRIFFLATICITLFLAKGANNPFQNIFLFIFTNIPFFGIYRAAYPKFIYFTALGYGVLTALGIFALAEHFLKKNKVIAGVVLTLIPLLICVYHFPLFTGTLLKKDSLITIPQEYQNSATIFAKDTTSYNVLSLPPAPRGSGLLLQWQKGTYVGPHPDMFFFNRPVLDSYWFYQKELADLSPGDSWTGIKFESRINSVLNYSPFLRVKYLVLHKDFLNSYAFGQDHPTRIDGTLKSKTLEKLLQNNKNIQLIESNKYFNVYKQTQPSYGLIYLPTKVVESPMPLQYIFKTFAHKWPEKNLVITEPSTTAYPVDSKTTISFKKVNPTRYDISVRNVSKPFSVIFLENYHEKWEIKGLDDIKHFKANGYANGWTIDPKTECKKLSCKVNSKGSYDLNLVLEYPAQGIFILGMTISLVTLGIVVWILVYKKVNKKNRV